MNIPHLLIVHPEAFSMGWMGSARRIIDIAAVMNALNWQVTLLRDNPFTSLYEGPERAFSGKVLRTPFRLNPPYPALLNYWGLRTLCVNWWKVTGQLGKINLEIDLERGWAGRLVRWYQKSVSISAPHIVWGISATTTLHGIVGARNLSQYLGCPLVLEFQDPLPAPQRPVLTAHEVKELESCYSYCKAVITTTEALAEHLRALYPQLRNKVHVIYPSYDETELLPPVTPLGTNTPLSLLHTGFLIGGTGRSALGLVHAMAEAFRREPAMRNDLRLRLVGAGPGQREASTLARKLGISSAVDVLSQVPPQELIHHLNEATVLVVIKFQDPAFNMQIPGKLFQYLGRGKPILGLMGVETEAASILRQSGLGLIVPGDDQEAIVKALLELWQKRVNLNNRFSPNWEYIKNFSRAEMGRKIYAILSNLVDLPQLAALQASKLLKNYE